MTARSAVVVVDTNVFGADLVRQGAPLATLYRPLLEGRSFVLSFQTVAELRFGALRQGWGTRRLDRLDERVARAHVVWPVPSCSMSTSTCGCDVSKAVMLSLSLITMPTAGSRQRRSDSESRSFPTTRCSRGLQASRWSATQPERASTGRRSRAARTARRRRMVSVIQGS